MPEIDQIQVKVEPTESTLTLCRPLIPGGIKNSNPLSAFFVMHFWILQSLFLTYIAHGDVFRAQGQLPAPLELGDRSG